MVRFDRDPATGRLTYRGCTTGETQSGPSGSNASRAIVSATSSGASSGLNGLTSLVMSPDGESLYGATVYDDSVVRFDRDPATGQLTYVGCITGKTQAGPGGSNACARIPSAASGGSNSGLDSLSSLAISPGDESVYASSELDDGASRFDRDSATGQLTYRGCITGETQSGPGGIGRLHPDRFRHVGRGGLRPQRATLAGGQPRRRLALHRIAVRRRRGSLRPRPGGRRAHLSGLRDREHGVRSRRLRRLRRDPKRHHGGRDSGLDTLRAVATSPDGKFVHVASAKDDGIALRPRRLRRALLPAARAATPRAAPTRAC